MIVKNGENICTEELLLPRVLKSRDVENTAELELGKTPSVSFDRVHSCLFTKKGACVLLDFGRELCGGLRLFTRGSSCKGGAEMLIRFGESVSEALAPLGHKNAGNDHSPREFTVKLSVFSDLTFGQTGFRFAYVELLGEGTVSFRNIYAVSRLPYFENEQQLRTNDSELNKILDTAAYTLKLCCQSGYMWDGIKRDRIVWGGDLHQEILTAYHLFGDIPNIKASISFLKEETPADKWINDIPNYSAWWVIILCDYYRLSGNRAFFEENADYAEQIIAKMDSMITEEGKMLFGDLKNEMTYYLDWPTCGTPDAEIGTAALCVYMAKKYAEVKENAACRSIIAKLNGYLNKPTGFKQIKAFQVLAGGSLEGAAELLERNGAEGFSTFMAYYILTADRIAGGEQMLPMIKEYFGAMLEKGATTFWEDFDLAWCQNSCGIDREPQEGESDIHGDNGRFCYQGFRHSLCHGWSSGVYSFVVESLAQGALPLQRVD